MSIPCAVQAICNMNLKSINFYIYLYLYPLQHYTLNKMMTSLGLYLMIDLGF